MKKYVKPTMQIEKIEMNQAIASCKNSAQGYYYDSDYTAIFCWNWELVENANLEKHNAERHAQNDGANSHVPAYTIYDKDGNNVGYYIPGSSNTYQGNNMWNVQPFMS